MRRLVEEALGGVMDPEIGISIIDLGLLIDADLTHNFDGTPILKICLATTSPACPMTAVIRSDAERAIRNAFPEIDDVVVTVDPKIPWSPERMNPNARQQLTASPMVKPVAPSQAGSQGVRLKVIPWMVVAFISLMLGLAGGLIRMGWTPPTNLESPVLHHGFMMVVGFLGTLIAVERAVALDRWWGWFAPALLALGAISLWFGQLQFVAPFTLWGSLLFLVSSLVFAHQQSWTATWTMSGGAGLLVFSVGWWGFGAGVTELIPSWTGFLVLTVAGERLELARLFGLSRVAKTTFQIAVALVLLSAFIAIWNLAISERLLGAGLVALSLWLGQYDIVRHQDRSFGLIRYVNTALLLGYGWMFLGGCLWLIYGGPLGGLFYDAALHSIFVGFVFSMVFAHAPLVFPAVTGLSLPFHRGLFLPLLFLHASLALRIVGGLSGNSLIRQWGGLLSVGSIILFFILLQLGRIYTKKTP